MGYAIVNPVEEVEGVENLITRSLISGCGQSLISGLFIEEEGRGREREVASEEGE
jgi:hypothetical protein